MKQISLFAMITFGVLNAAILSQTPVTNSLIVYNSNMALVHEERSLALQPSDKEIVYKGVANTINIDSINVELPHGVEVYLQQYRYDKLTQQKLLEANIGKIVEISGNKVTLLSYLGAECIVKSVKNKIMTVETKNIVFQKVPDSLLTQPTLVWKVQTDKNIDANMKLDYVIKNISWHSNYILNLDANKADLSAWISINNRAGKSFTDTSLYVLAGDVNRVEKYPTRPVVRYMKTMSADTSLVQEKAHEGYHFYTIPFKVNLKNNEKTQIKFLHKTALNIHREYSAMLSNPRYLRGETKSNVVQYVKLDGLDIALPQGVVRTYSKLNNTSILLGESRLKHTPKNTPIKLKLGKNFDLTVTQSVSSREDYKKSFQSNVKYTLKNESDEDKNVELFVPFNTREKSRVQTDQKYTFTKGNVVTFHVQVKANARKIFDVSYESKK